MGNMVREQVVATERSDDSLAEIRLITEAEGEYAVICDGEIVGSGLSFAEAIGVGTEKTPLAPFLVQRLAAG